MVLTYELVESVPGSMVRHTQKRVVVTYDDAGEELASSGPFGTQTRESISAEVLTEAQAKAKAVAAMEKTWYEGRDVSFTCSPLYGLEQGDMIWVLIPNGTGFGGQLMGATIPLHASGGTWQLTVKTYKQLDKSWVPKYLYSKDWVDAASTIDDNVDWVVHKPMHKVGLDTNYPSGWHVTHGTIQGKSPDSLTAKATGGGDLDFYTDQEWRVEAERRYQVRASVAAVTHSITVRIGLNYEPGGIRWGAWRDIAARKSATLSYDDKSALVPVGSKTVGIYVQVRHPASDRVVRINSASLEYGQRAKP
jgi:hypothetical protein